MPKKRLFKDRCADYVLNPTGGMIKNKEIGKTHDDAVEKSTARLAFDSAASQ
jgi:hypothetical protein